MIKIMIDSASDIDAAEAEKLGVELIPMEIKFEDGEYLDGVTLSREKFFEKLIENTELPHTSQINPFRFEEAFEKLTAAGDDVICITISSKLSGTYKSACQAAETDGLPAYMIGSTIGTHIGPGAIGVAFYSKIK